MHSMYYLGDALMSGVAMRELISARLVASLQKSGGRAEVWDIRLPNFFVQIRQSGHASFFVRTKCDGHLINRRLGDAATLSVAEARRMGVRLLQENVRQDLFSQRTHQEAMKRPNAMTLAEAMDAYYIPHAKATKKSWFLDVSLLRQHILPVFGSRFIATIGTPEIDQWHKALRSEKGRSPMTCNHALFVLRRFYKLALETWQLPGLVENPAHKVANFKVDNQRHVYLKQDEIQRLQQAAQRLKNPVVAPVIALLLLTGVRLQNALRARWDQFDEAAQVWHVPYTKSGKPQDVWLSDAALALLRGLSSRDHSPWLFPHPRSNVPMRDMHYAWRQLQEQARLPGVRLHDLRHTFASIMIQEGYSLYVVQNALGHHSPTMTMRYAHLANSTLKQAVNAVGKAVHNEA